MNEIKNDGENIGEIVFNVYNNGVDFLKNNKGLFAQVGLGAAELFAGIKGFKYAKELDNSLLYFSSAIPVFLGGWNILLGSFIRPMYNVLYVKPYIESKIKNGEILRENINKEREKLGPLFSNKRFKCFEQIIVESIKDNTWGYKNQKKETKSF